MVQRSVRSACERRSSATFVKVTHRMDDKNLLSRAPPYSESHVDPGCILQSLAPTPVSKRVDVRQAAGLKNNCQIFTTITT
jgi:hypothetical protein